MRRIFVRLLCFILPLLLLVESLQTVAQAYSQDTDVSSTEKNQIVQEIDSSELEVVEPESNTDSISEEADQIDKISEIFEDSQVAANPEDIPTIAVSDIQRIADLQRLSEIMIHNLDSHEISEAYQGWMYWYFIGAPAWITNPMGWELREDIYNDLLHHWYGDNPPANGRFMFLRDQGFPSNTILRGYLFGEPALNQTSYGIITSDAVEASPTMIEDNSPYTLRNGLSQAMITADIFPATSEDLSLPVPVSEDGVVTSMGIDFSRSYEMGGVDAIFIPPNPEFAASEFSRFGSVFIYRY